jgi:DNA (cytosine-5)-methyltransferase 1
LYLEIVRELQTAYTVEFVVFENVLGMRDKKYANTYKALVEGIGDLGFEITEKELCAADFGVPQNRRRIVLCRNAKRPRIHSGSASAVQGIADGSRGDRCCRCARIF